MRCSDHRSRKPEGYWMNLAEGIDKNKIPYRVGNILSNKGLKFEKKIRLLGIVRGIIEKFTLVSNRF
jgi:hypothetical protein